MNQKPRSGYALLALLIFSVAITVTNPEIRAFLFFVDVIGLDVLFLLLAIQLRDQGTYVFRRTVLPSARLFVRLSPLPCVMPNLAAVKAMPSLLLLAMPVWPMLMLACVSVLVWHLITLAFAVA